MTPGEYRAKLRALGLTQRRFLWEGGSIYEGRDGQFYNVADPEPLTADEREAIIQLFEDLLDP